MSLVLNTNLSSLVAQNSLTSSGSQARHRVAAVVIGPADQHGSGRRRRLRDQPEHDLADQRHQPGRAQRQRRRVAGPDRLGRLAGSRERPADDARPRGPVPERHQQLDRPLGPRRAVPAAEAGHRQRRHPDPVQRRQPARRHLPGRQLPGRCQLRSDHHRVLDRQLKEHQHRPVLQRHGLLSQARLPPPPARSLPRPPVPQAPSTRRTSAPPPTSALRSTAPRSN